MPVRIIICTFYLLCSVIVHAQSQMLVAVQSARDSVIIFNLTTGKQQGQIKVGFLPHEITYDPVRRMCFVSNFGLQDYDIRIGRPGNSISVFDPWSNTYVKTIYTTADTSKGNGPHGVKIRPGPHRELYINVEVGGDSMLIYDAETYLFKRSFSLPKQSHNFIFSADGSRLWIMAASEGVFEVDPETGRILHHQTFSSPIRGLAFGKNWLVASGKNEVFLISKDDLHIVKHFPDLNVGQILYSNVSADQKLLLCPAVAENMLLVINARSGAIIKRLPTFKAPINVQVVGNKAYVSHDEDSFIDVINLKGFTKSLLPAYGTNGIIILK